MIIRVFQYYASSLRTYTLPRPNLEALQIRKLRHLLTSAYEQVPYYHDLLRRVDMKPTDFGKLADLKRIPVLTKKEAIENAARLLSARAAARYRRIGSGTTGTALTVAYDQEWRDLATALQGRRLTKFGMRPWHRLVSVRAPKKYWRKDTTGKLKDKPYTLVDEMGPLASLGVLSTRVSFLQASQDDPASDAKKLRRLKPDFIMAPMSHMLRMSEFVPSGEMSVRGINGINEGFTDVAARKVEGVFGGRVLHSYGSNELGAAGAECKFQRGMHLNEDWVLYEVLRDGEPVGPGEQGELVATVFRNEAMPLVRYATGDTVELADGGACECGSSMIRVRRMLGRRHDWLRLSGGVLLAPTVLAEEIEGKFGMRDYQLIQHGARDFEVKTFNPDSDERTMGTQLEAYLSERGGAPVKLRFTCRSREEMWLKSRPVLCAME